MNPVNIENGKRAESENPEGSPLKSSNKFDISIIGKIDLAEAEKIASEEVIFLTESDLIEGLEDFELVPIKNYKDDNKSNFIFQPDVTETLIKKEEILKEQTKTVPETLISEIQDDKKSPNKIAVSFPPVIETVDTTQFEAEIPELKTTGFEITEEVEKKDESEIYLEVSVLEPEKITEIKEYPVFEETSLKTAADEFIEEIIEESSSTRKLFAVKINEETLDAQLSAILSIEDLPKKDDRILEKYGEAASDSRCKFVDDQFFNKPESEDSVSYNEDPLTERLVKMIEVADGKLELLEKTTKEEEILNYILEDYTLYNSEKFDNVFKEEAFYIDSDFEFIDNAIIRDDFTKYIHEIDDYFESEESLIQSEISEILGLIPDENEYIEDKLFGDYYKRYDLDNEIDFIKPEIDFFRSNYAGKKNPNYFSENEISLLDSERISIEEDISSPDAIIFQEDVSEIETILKRDYNVNLNNNIKEDIQVTSEILSAEEITDITDKIIILDDKEKLMELVSEYPEKHENLIRLLSYLDGLFEKLPEEVIRKFAESEYFELYSKVLKEMGV
jgi:hypothetical protein